MLKYMKFQMSKVREISLEISLTTTLTRIILESKKLSLIMHLLQKLNKLLTIKFRSQYKKIRNLDLSFLWTRSSLAMTTKTKFLIPRAKIQMTAKTSKQSNLKVRPLRSSLDHQIFYTQMRNKKPLLSRSKNSLII